MSAVLFGDSTILSGKIVLERCHAYMHRQHVAHATSITVWLKHVNQCGPVCRAWLLVLTWRTWECVPAQHLSGMLLLSKLTFLKT